MKNLNNVFFYLNVSWIFALVLILFFLYFFNVGYEYEGSTLSEIFNR